MIKKKYAKTFWRYSSRIVMKNQLTKQSIKSLVYESPYSKKPKLYCATLRVSNNLIILKRIVKKYKLCDKMDTEEFYKICCQLDEFLNCPQDLTYNKIMMDNKQEIFTFYEKRCKNKLGESKSMPKFIRINTLKGKKGDILAQLENDFSKHVEDFPSYKKYLNFLIKIQPKTFIKDYHFDIYAFPSDTNFCGIDAYKSGKIVIQNKASCMPALALNPPLNSVVIDACAAPGNKTSHIAQIMKNTGKIYAIDKDEKRFKLMESQLKKQGVLNTDCINMDFLKMDPLSDNGKTIKYILVDPSCSGSGIDRNESVEKTSDVSLRIKKLSNFQAMLLNHAFLFENVQSIVYSTCSIHEEENESVVQEVYRKNKEKFKLETILKGIKTRGLDHYPFYKKVVRVGSNDGCVGFFVAKFTRKDL